MWVRDEVGWISIMLMVTGMTWHKNQWFFFPFFLVIPQRYRSSGCPPGITWRKNNTRQFNFFWKCLPGSSALLWKCWCTYTKKSVQNFLWSLKGLIQEGEGTNVGSKFKPPAPPQGRHPATNEIPSPSKAPLWAAFPGSLRVRFHDLPFTHYLYYCKPLL
jgi:hypothetical protein